MADTGASRYAAGRGGRAYRRCQLLRRRARHGHLRPDAYVNDNRREIRGADAIREFVAKEFVGDHVTMEVREIVDRYGDIIVRATGTAGKPAGQPTMRCFGT